METIFSKKEAQLNKLFEDIDYGDLGLPELQRPFVWGNNKVRDLFDSMYRGFPIGYFLFWENDNNNGKYRQIGNDEKSSKIPKSLIIDGQQRLTALYSVFKNKKVLDKNYALKKIKISFNPLIEKFEVANASTERNKEYIEDITTLFSQPSFSFINQYFEQLKNYKEDVAKKREIIIQKIEKDKKLNSVEVEFVIARFNQIKEPREDEIKIITKLKDKIEIEQNENNILIEILNNNIGYDKSLIGKRIEKLGNLISYPYQALEISGDVEEELVAEIFTRINSKGTILNQADFVLTLLSVFWDEGRKQIDDFSKNCKTVPDKKSKYSSFNYVIEPDAQDIVRVIVGLGFKRGRMKDAYSILKGRNLTTRKYSEKLQGEQFNIFKEKQQIVLDNTNWHNFLKILIGLGFKGNELISSKLAVIYAYVFYLIGETEYQMENKELQKYISKWFFFINLTSRYSSSPESQMDSDLNKVKICKTKQDFINYIDETINSSLTTDFWNITLPNDLLVTSSARSPAGNTFFACQIKNNIRVLFSERKVSDLFDPSLKLRKKSLERHHVFPKNYLVKLQYEQTQRNQIANMTYLEFQDNIKIGDSEPKKYFEKMKNKYYKDDISTLNKMLKGHCIPANFYDLKYDEFLTQRRKLMANLIKKTFYKI